VTRRKSGNGGKRTKRKSWYSRLAIVIAVFAAAVGAGFFLMGDKIGFSSTEVASTAREPTAASEPAPAVQTGTEPLAADEEPASTPAATSATDPSPGGSRENGASEAPAASQPGFVSQVLPYLLMLVLAVLGGYIGGWYAFRSMGIKEHLERIDREFQDHWRATDGRLRDLREKMQAPAARPGPREHSSYAVPGGERLERERHDGISQEQSGTRNAGAERETAAARHRELPNLSALAAQYGQLTRGNISRSDFARFFDSLGESMPVESCDGGRGLQQAQGEGFLTAVGQGDHIIVFPSYTFVANWDTQFTTMASVPESVTELFDLSRGDGEIVMAAPALFDRNGGSPLRIERGKLHGFQG
jgi:hypothetical protein